MATFRNRLVVVIGLAAAAAVVGLILVGIALNSYFDPFDDQPFQQSNWATAVPKIRSPMARDAI